MEITFRVADSAKSMLGSSQSPKDAWDALERRFGARQEGIQSSLISKLQMAAWNGSGSILTHRDYMVDLRSQLRDAGMNLTDQAFYSYFTESLPPSLDLFVTLYEDNTFDVDLLCDKFSKYEMRQKLRVTKSGRGEGSSDGNIALFGQQSAEKGKEKKKRDLLDVTCYGCGKKGHLRRYCPTKKNEKPKIEKLKNEKPATQAEASTSKADKAVRPRQRNLRQGLSTPRWLMPQHPRTVDSPTASTSIQELPITLFHQKVTCVVTGSSSVLLRSPLPTVAGFMHTGLVQRGLRHPLVVSSARPT